MPLSLHLPVPDSTLKVGVPARQGARTDLSELRADLRAGHSLRRVSDDHFDVFLRYHRGIQLYRLLHLGSRQWPMQVIVLYGKAGTGKSRAAEAMAPEAFRLPLSQGSSGSGWWDGYDGQDDVIIDEFYGQLRWAFMLQLLDRYPLTVETKGGSCSFVGRRVIFTSNKAPWDWYDKDRIQDQGPLKRRLSSVYQCSTDCFYRIDWP